MNLAETHDLLRLVASFDNRRFDDATVISWQQVLDDLPFADAQTGVLRHFRDSSEWLMPVHIRRIVAELNRQRGEVERSERLRRQLEALDSVAAEPVRDRSPEVKAMLAELAEKLGRGRPEAFRRPEWLENDRARDRMARAERNPAYTGPPPQGGWPLPEPEDTRPPSMLRRVDFDIGPEDPTEAVEPIPAEETPDA